MNEHPTVAKPDHLKGRQGIIEAVRRELVGPSVGGHHLDLSGVVRFATREESWSPWRDAATGEEILKYQQPLGRYGIGVLYPIETRVDETGNVDQEDVEDVRDRPCEGVEVEPPRVSTTGGRTFGTDDDDYALSRANDYRPSCLGLTFLVDPLEVDLFAVRVTGGRYQPIRIVIPESGERRWWVRSPVGIDATFDVLDLRREGQRIHPRVDTTNLQGLDIQVVAHRRAWGSLSLVTVSLVNRTESLHDLGDETRGLAHASLSSLFQVQMKVEARRADGSGAILPYPAQDRELSHRDQEEESFDLLYRKHRTFAIGHGCAADWDDPEGRASVGWVRTEALPSYEAPSITPDIEEDGKKVTVSMARLAGLDVSMNPLAECADLIHRYRQWIDKKRKETEEIPKQYREAAWRHMEMCGISADRMEEGLRLLQSDGQVAKAFELANHAVLLQQLRTRETVREIDLDQSDRRFAFKELFSPPDWEEESDRGRWRPFQIAFFLAAIPSVAFSSHRDRSQVELIWFPTGGGKTEAYLGLSAFSMFLRRLRDPEDTGTEIIMRYTLRLLTTQQFLRASTLICAMEHLRNYHSEMLGKTRFTIGVWLGMSATPNSRNQAKKGLGRLRGRDSHRAENPFLLLRCPWCSAQMGPLIFPRRKRHRGPKVAGYEQEGDSVVFRCPDNTCEFSDTTLPIHVIDEDIYQDPPSMIIGTVDKFAQLTWQPPARALFGINPAGSRSSSPPGLIIQDELHLISGPLGSMVGLYEPLIEELCTDLRTDPAIRPKIISSTATIRRYEEQVGALYGRNRVALFPPPGLDADDSFFARYDRYPDGTLRPGRVYLGVYGRGLGSTQIAQVRVLAALLQAPNDLPEELRDPWWTLLTFFNSLRELGAAISLAHSNIPDYLETIRRRYGYDRDRKRRVRFLKELTGRIPQDQVPKAIEELSRPVGNEAVDFCLASNIIEVGIDIERLALLVVVGQPKSTSQYIQVTGRIGRRWRERPGLVITILHPSRPRDRSHFERFRSYHERLYAQVEPTSVTPFAPPVLSRALHGVLCGYVRQMGPVDVEPWPLPAGLISQATQMLNKRVQAADPDEMRRMTNLLDQRVEEWKMWERTEWSAPPWAGEDSNPLLRRAGAGDSASNKRKAWPTPTSLRDVDAECRFQITDAYTETV